MRTWLPALMAFTVASQAARSVEACGDKFLLVGRGTRFQRAYAAIHRASIVVYAQPQRRAAKAIRDPQLHADLKLAGHRVLVAEDETALGRALDSGDVDLVLADAADADRVAKRAENSQAKPAVLPVMYEPTKEEAREIEARYMCRLTASDRAGRYLTAIDDAMKVRVGQKKKATS